MATDFSWIYLVIFLAIPLARIIPRLISKRKNYSSKISGQTQQDSSRYSNIQKEFSKPQTKNVLVLEEIKRGSKTFERIQKNLGIDNKELDEILEELENNGLLKVHQKQGFFGTKIELYPTEKGFKEYS